MSVITGMELMELLRLDDGSKWGDTATDVQRADAEAILDLNSPTRYHFITRARGYGKTSDVAAVALAVLLTQAPPQSRSYTVAADEDQALLLLDSMNGFIHRAPPPMDDLLDIRAGKVTNKHTGATVEAIAADAAGTWGLRPYFAVVDEVANWGSSGTPRRVWDAITSALPKTGGRLVVITTPSSPAHWAKKVRDHADTDPVWRLSEQFGAPPWMSPDLLAEQKRRLIPAMYERLFEGRWTSADDSLVSEDDLAACVVLDGPLPPQPNVHYTIGLDIGVSRDRSVATVTHAEPVRKQIDSHGTEITAATRVVLDRIERWAGSRDHKVQLEQVEEWVAHAAKTYNGAPVRLDPWQAIGMAQRLEARGVRCEEFTFSASSVGRIASALHRQLRDRMLALPDDQDLIDELRNVRLRESAPGVVRLDHGSDGHDDQAVSLAMCVHALLDAVPGPPPHAHFKTFDAWDVEPGSLEQMLTEVEQRGGAKLEPGMRL